MTPNRAVETGGRILSRTAAAIVLGCVCLAAPVGAADLAGGGAVSGWVTDERGVPQMGALVAVLTAEGEMVKRVFTSPSGSFQAEGLTPGQYMVRVSLARFLPLVKDTVAVRDGANTILSVSMRSLFASLQLSFPGAGEIRDMTDDWKWTLRATHSIRPVLRFTDQLEARERERVLRKITGAFSDTQAYAQISGGAGVTPSALANQSDLGTSFALATSVFGDNNVTVSGNLGYSAAAQSPTTGFRTSYQRDFGLGAPEVSVTVRQLQTGAARMVLDPQQGGDVPALETFSLGFGDRVELSESTSFEYGFLYESVNFLQRLNFVSPYGKIVQQLTPRRSVEIAYASGAPRPGAAVRGSESLRQEVSSLGMFPRVALRDGDATVQRTDHVEVAYKEQIGKGLIEAAVYQDSINDAAISAFVPQSYQAGGQVLPDLFSRSSTINGGDHQLRGYRVSYARKIKDRLEAALGYGNSGVVTASTHSLQTAELGELRDGLTVERAHLLMASISATVPRSDTQLISSYQWSSRTSALAPDLYNEFAARSEPGLNLLVRQPLPINTMLPGKFELTADIRNLLKAGYIPIQGHDGQTIYLLQAIRAYRGSLSFIF